MALAEYVDKYRAASIEYILEDLDRQIREAKLEPTDGVLAESFVAAFSKLTSVIMARTDKLRDVNDHMRNAARMSAVEKVIKARFPNLTRQDCEQIAGDVITALAQLEN